MNETQELEQKLARLEEAADKGWKEHSLKPVVGTFYEWDVDKPGSPLCACCLLTAAFVSEFGKEHSCVRPITNDADAMMAMLGEKFGFSNSQLHTIYRGFDSSRNTGGGSDLFRFGKAMRKKAFG